jgi:FKBP-type peptidyl-prolyl cis-trans isomerase FkpA
MKVVPAELHFLQNVIKGWTEEFPFKEGSSGTLLIPSPGYGSNDSNGITGGSVLVFDVKLISVK